MRGGSARRGKGAPCRSRAEAAPGPFPPRAAGGRRGAGGAGRAGGGRPEEGRLLLASRPNARLASPKTARPAVADCCEVGVRGGALSSRPHPPARGAACGAGEGGRGRRRGARHSQHSRSLHDTHTATPKAPCAPARSAGTTSSPTEKRTSAPPPRHPLVPPRTTAPRPATPHPALPHTHPTHTRTGAADRVRRARPGLRGPPTGGGGCRPWAAAGGAPRPRRPRTEPGPLARRRRPGAEPSAMGAGREAGGAAAAAAGGGRRRGRSARGGGRGAP